MVKASRPVDPTLDEIGSPGKTMMLEWARATRTVTGTLSTPEPPVSVVSARAGPEADTATAAAVSRPAPSVIRRDRRPKVTCIDCTPLRVRVAGGRNLFMLSQLLVYWLLFGCLQLRR